MHIRNSHALHNKDDSNSTLLKRLSNWHQKRKADRGSMGWLFHQYYKYWSHKRDELAWEDPTWAAIERRRRIGTAAGMSTFVDEALDLGIKEYQIQKDIEDQLMPRDSWFSLHGFIWQLHWWHNDHRPSIYYYRLKRFIQRGKRGYSYRDAMSLHHYVAKIIASIARNMADKGISYPGTQEVPTFEAWQKVLREMADSFDAACADRDMPEDFLNRSQEERREFYEQEKKGKEAARDRAIELFGKHFFDLWD